MHSMTSSFPKTMPSISHSRLLAIVLTARFETVEMNHRTTYTRQLHRHHIQDPHHKLSRQWRPKNFDSEVNSFVAFLYFAWAIAEVTDLEWLLLSSILTVLIWWVIEAFTISELEQSNWLTSIRLCNSLLINFKYSRGRTSSLLWNLIPLTLWVRYKNSSFKSWYILYYKVLFFEIL